MRVETLYINNNKVDLDKKTKIVINRDFVDLQNPEARLGDSSQNIKLPKTKNNNIIFEHVNVQNSENKFVKTIDFDCVYYVDGRVIIEGIFRILSVDLNYYNGVILGGGVAWSKLLSGKTLRDLKNDDLITSWSVPFTGWSAGTTNSLSYYINNINYNTQDICFPLISYGAFYTNNDTQLSNQIYLDSVANDDIPPAVYDLKIVKRIFQNIGWNVNSSIFSNTECQNVFMPFTVGDRYIWNYGQIISAQAIGYNNIYPWTLSAPTNADYSPTITFVNDYCNQKNTDYMILDYDNLIYNPNGNITHINLSGQAGITTQYLYQTPITDLYSFDVEINNWKFENWGLYRTDYLTQFASAINPFLSSSAYTSTYYLRNGFFIYLDTLDGQYFGQISDNINRYCWEFYESYGSPLDIDNDLIIAAYIPSHTGTTTYFQPYNNDANIIVTGNSEYITYTGWTGPSTYYHIELTGNTKFEIRDLNIPSGFCVKVAAFGPAFSSGSTNTFYGTNISNEITTGFSAQSVSVNYFSSKNDDIDLNLTNNFPEISQLDYIKSWINRYNLLISADYQNKVINFEPFRRYFLDNNFAIDLTNKVNTNYFEPETEPVKLPKIVNFKYNNDINDAMLKIDKDYGNLKIASDNIYNENEKDISLLFSATKMRDFDIVAPGYSVSASTISLPSIANDDNYNSLELSAVTWSFAGQPRLLKLTGQYATDLSGNTIYIRVGDNDSKILLSEFENETQGKLSLSYDGDNGLYANYFEDYYSQLGDSFIINLDSKINPEDFSKMNTNVPITINGQSYILNQIKNFDSTSESSVEISLIKKFIN